MNCKFKFHSQRRGVTKYSESRHPDGCLVLVKDRTDHDAGTCGGRDLCYFCVNENAYNAHIDIDERCVEGCTFCADDKFFSERGR